MNFKFQLSKAPNSKFDFFLKKFLTFFKKISNFKLEKSTYQVQNQNKEWEKKFEYQQHPVFPGGHPSKYWRGSMLLNFGDRTRTGAFSMIWPLTRKVSLYSKLLIIGNSWLAAILLSQMCPQWLYMACTFLYDPNKAASKRFDSSAK